MASVLNFAFIPENKMGCPLLLSKIVVFSVARRPTNAFQTLKGCSSTSLLMTIRVFIEVKDLFSSAFMNFLEARRVPAHRQHTTERFGLTNKRY
jgi:hypothetical protein